MSKLTILTLQFSLVALFLCALCVSSPLLSALNSSPSVPPLDRPKIIGIAGVAFVSTQLAQAQGFYENILGLPRVNTDLDPGTHGDARCDQNAEMCFAPAEGPVISLVSPCGGDVRCEPESLFTVTFLTSDAPRLREFLKSQNVLVSEPRLNGKDFSAFDPDHHRIRFIDVALSDRQTGSGHRPPVRLIHAGFVVKNREAEDRFYKDILGFHVYWHGGMKDSETDWVDMQVPDGTQWLEYMLNVPPNASHRTLGVMNHIALGVSDIHAAEQQLIKNGWKATEQPQIGRDGKWQLNLYDPDGTRVELMEFTPVEKPCCSEYTGPHPKP
ncbi:MAG TPA: VOC family protein [Candidatus Acidoferrum sp.]|nr:VOC family protein [Candidatus Acidoferrum sp.]